MRYAIMIYIPSVYFSLLYPEVRLPNNCYIFIKFELKIKIIKIKKYLTYLSIYMEVRLLHCCS